MTIPAFNHQSVLSFGFGVYPRCVSAEWASITTPAAAESVETDTGCAQGQGILFLIGSTGGHFLRIGLYDTSGDSAGGGQLLPANLWPILRTNSTTASRYFAVNIQGSRNRYFRLYTDTIQAIYWKFERS